MFSQFQKQLATIRWTVTPCKTVPTKWHQVYSKVQVLQQCSISLTLSCTNNTRRSLSGVLVVIRFIFINTKYVYIVKKKQHKVQENCGNSSYHHYQHRSCTCSGGLPKKWLSAVIQLNCKFFSSFSAYSSGLRVYTINIACTNMCCLFPSSRRRREENLGELANTNWTLNKKKHRQTDNDRNSETNHRDDRIENQT